MESCDANLGHFVTPVGENNSGHEVVSRASNLNYLRGVALMDVSIAFFFFFFFDVVAITFCQLSLCVTRFENCKFGNVDLNGWKIHNKNIENQLEIFSRTSINWSVVKVAVTYRISFYSSYAF